MSEHFSRPTLDDLLAAHAAGSLPLPMALAVGTHLALSPPSRRHYRVFEALGGALLERIAPAALAPDAWAKLSARLDGEGAGARGAVEAPPPPPRREPAPVAGGPALLMPRPLRDYLPGPAGHLSWQARTTAVHEAEMDLGTPDFDAALIYVRAGQPYPGHEPHEVDLVLTLEGGSQGQAGHFVRGDLSILGPGDSRLRTADEGPDWLWLRVLGSL